MQIKFTNYKRALKLFFFFFFVSNSILGSSNLNKKHILQFDQIKQTSYIKGRILDAKTKKPIAFTTIILKKSSLGYYASEEGDFSIKNSIKNESDVLLISSIGYVSRSILFSSLKKNEINYIYLEEANEKLNEITITSTKKRKRRVRRKNLIREAIKKIPDNYPIQSFTHVSYYREYLKRNGKYSNLNEAIIQTIDTGFNTPYYYNKFRLLDYKKNKDFPRETFIPDKYDSIWQTPDYQQPNKFIPYGKIPNQGGNEFFILLAHDPIRNYDTNSFAFIYKFSRDFLRNHSFKKPEKVYQNDMLLYKVNYKSRMPIKDQGVISNSKNEVPETKSHYVLNASGEVETDAVIINGEIYINPKDYTIHKIKYKADLESTKKKIYELALEYGYTDNTKNLMRLKYISFNNEFFTIDQNDEDYFKVTTIDQPKRLNYREILVRTNALIDEKNATSKYSYDFFQNDKKLEIDKVEIEGKNIRIFFSKPYDMDIRFSFWIRNIRDIEGRVINERKVVRFYQYRELFVQDFEKQLSFDKKCYMVSLPLNKNCLSTIPNNNEYFMNSPLQNDN